MAETIGRCMQGMDVNHKRRRGYRPLLNLIPLLIRKPVKNRDELPSSRSLIKTSARENSIDPFTDG